MAANPTTRRHLLALTLFSCAGAALPANAFTVEEPAWLTHFSKQLEQFSVRLRRQTGPAGEVEFHCEMRDTAAWARSFSKLAAEGAKVSAKANVLTFSRGGQSVRVIMSPLQAA